MADNGLLFIPDISGFTKFVNETEIDHSRIIIEELLENIINSIKLACGFLKWKVMLCYFTASATARLLKRYTTR